MHDQPAPPDAPPEEGQPTPTDVPPDEATEPVEPDAAPEEEGPPGPFTRLSDDLTAGRIKSDEALRRLLAGLAFSETADTHDPDALTAAVYADEYDDDGQPHAPRD